MTVGENIRRIRQERGLTLKQLGEMVGVSEAYIRAYESGRRNPKLKSLEALEEVAKGDANKVFIPFEATNALSSLGAMKEIVKDDKKWDKGDRSDLSHNIN